MNRKLFIPSFIQVGSEVSWWGSNIFCTGVNAQSYVPRWKHLIEWGILDWLVGFMTLVIMLIHLVTGFYTGLSTILERKMSVIYILKLSWWQISVKSSWVDSFIRWFKSTDILETDFSSIIRVLSPNLHYLTWLQDWEGFIDISDNEFSFDCPAGMST
jgi:hypothetical protein